MESSLAVLPSGNNTPETMIDTTAATPPPPPPARASLLGLPLEIRLQIYGWVHLNNPVAYRQLVPWLPSPRQDPYFVRALTADHPCHDSGSNVDSISLTATVAAPPDAPAGAAQENEGVAGDASTEPGEAGDATNSVVVAAAESTNETNESAAAEPAVVSSSKAPPKASHDGRACKLHGSSSSSSSSSTPKPRLLTLTPYRPMARMPTALLQTCRSIYHEARSLPFAENEFAFATWFSSGAATARAFVKGLAPWQSSAVRHVRLEVRAGTDLFALSSSSSRAACATCPCVGGETGVAVFNALCGLLAPGLRTLRLRIALPSRSSTTTMMITDAAGAAELGVGGSGGSGSSSGSGNGISGAAAASAASPGECAEPEERLLRDTVTATARDGDTAGDGSAAAPPATTTAVWIDAGLRKLGALRTLEVELGNSLLGDAEKVAWNRRLQDAVNAGRGEHDELVSVVAVEKVSIPDYKGTHCPCGCMY